MRIYKAALGLGLLGATIAVVSVEPAFAACHKFTVEASPTRVNEGTKVTVTISWDGTSDPSSIDVETVDDTARGGQDYAKVDPRTISFTNETSQTFDIGIANDATPEGDETFKIHLSKPAGCAANPRFDVGDDAGVTIAASDTPGATAVTPTVPATRAAPTTTATIPGTVAPTTETTDDAIPDLTDKDGGISDGAIIAAIVVALAAATAGFIIWRRRMAADGRLDGPPDGPRSRV